MAKTSNGTLKVGLLGVGQGSAHGEIFRRHIHQTEVAAVCDLDETSLKEAAERFGATQATTDYGRMLSNADLDVIVVATGCHDHGRQCVAALEAGKHVLVEVPAVSLSLDEVWRMVWAAERNKRRLMMGNHHRFALECTAAKAAIDSGRIGEPFYGEGEYWHSGYPMATALDDAFQKEGYMRIDFDGRPLDDPPHWRLGFGGPAQETMSGGGGSHALDTVRWLMGEEFCEVTAYGNRKMLPYRAADDFQIALFKTPSGAIARVAVSYMMIRPFSVAMSVYGTQGSLEGDRFKRAYWVSDNARDYNQPMRPLEVPAEDIPAEQSRGCHGPSNIRQDKDFIEALLAGRQPSCHVYEAARSCAAGICAMQSAREGRPIRIPSFHDRMA